jgi:hypothetical protein
MIDSTLLGYIKKSLEEGVSKETITSSLLASGWQQSAISEAFAAATAPVAPNSAPKAPASQSKGAIRNYEIYSIYSVLLAIILFFGLFILANKIINDVEKHFYDVTGRLIFDAIIILPFLVIAFVIQLNLTGKGEKYRILSQPYFLVSGLAFNQAIV